MALDQDPENDVAIVSSVPIKIILVSGALHHFWLAKSWIAIVTWYELLAANWTLGYNV
jgi:hypothetical protein